MLSFSVEAKEKIKLQNFVEIIEGVKVVKNHTYLSKLRESWYDKMFDYLIEKLLAIWSQLPDRIALPNFYNEIPN